MKVLYLSCHSILEAEELTLFHELGYEVFSPGAYFDPQNPNELRPGIPGLTYNPDVVAKYNEIGAAHPGEDAKNYLTKDFVDYFDVVVVMHLPQWISNNWEVLKGKRVIWRTIGQSVASTELKLLRYRSGIQIVRYSPMEATIPAFIGQDGLIRFYKDPELYKGWNGQIPGIMTVAQSMIERDAACNFTFFEQTTRPYNRALFGSGSESLPWGRGKVTFEELREAYQNYRCYFYTGTHPASYTLNFIEAFMTGIPVVAIGPQHGNSSSFGDHYLYEVHQLIEHGVNGFVSDDVHELQACVETLIRNPEYALQISEAGRKEAIRHFDKNMIKLAWKDFLEKGKEVSH
jgi:hypothetical protein